MEVEKIYFNTVCKVWSRGLLFVIWCVIFFLLKPAVQGKISYIVYGALFVVVVGFTIWYFLICRHKRNLLRIYERYLNSYNFEEFFHEDLALSKETTEVFQYLAEKLNKARYLNLSKKQAQYLALQNQINPHFLYNTLECIRSEAVTYGADGVAYMTEALATFFRYTISNVDMLVRLEDELANVENYYVIQRYRFGDRLKIQIEYDNETDLSILELFMPKLILQPIVENSIYYGLEPKIGEGYVRIKVERTKEYLIIRISDNGVGMENKVLEELNGKLLRNSSDELEEAAKKKGGIAIQNVNNRIKLLFGEQYGVHINSVSGMGTDVEITLPVISKNVQENDEKRSF